MKKKSRKAQQVHANEKVWFIFVENRQDGPFSLYDLKKDSRLTPDTLIWKKGFKNWRLAREVTEIAEAFEDDKPPPQDFPEPSKDKTFEGEVGAESQVTLTLQQDPNQYILWILIVILIAIYVFYQFFGP